MPWRDLTLAKSCNRCRRPLAVGAHVYQGEITGAIWCADCGAGMGLHADRPEQRTEMASIAEWAAYLKATYPKRRDLSARIVGERDE